jgi:hypothetical protein
MLGKMVNFAGGLAWPSVICTGSRRVTVNFLTPAGAVASVPRLSFDLAAEGKPRAWSASIASAGWRSFVEAMDDADNDNGALMAFVGRYGDPLGRLAADRATDTADWFNLVAELAPLAGAWGSADAEGVSRVERTDDAIAWLRFAGLKQLAPQITLIPDPTGAPDLAPRVDSLAAFMQASAVSALKRKAQMRRCRRCSLWFELSRRDAFYCSSVCRMAHHRDQVTAELEAMGLGRLADPEGFRRKQAEMATIMRSLDPAERRRKQAEMDALMRHLNKKRDNKKD